MEIDIKQTSASLFQLSNQQDLTLFLIRKELEGTKFMDDLASVGFDRFRYDPNLAGVILALMGFKVTEEILDSFCEIQKKYTEKVNLDNIESINALALQFYSELIQNKR
ncbi:hypothetical protein [Aquimarina agarilytica]|uniref:hypothetical protein n=1 Tax=Aquimarina agarilytica TaxID=1087449 RepID=UPI000287B9C1|nr:hypothetical protein [Aquimarina agarilytica]